MGVHGFSQHEASQSIDDFLGRIPSELGRVDFWLVDLVRHVVHHLASQALPRFAVLRENAREIV